MHIYKSTNIRNILKKTNRDWNRKIISLQTDEIGDHVMHGLEPAKKDWLETYKLIKQCKTVHSVDTAVAHLAGGMNCRVELYIGKNCDWRWKVSRNNWYKNMKLNNI